VATVSILEAVELAERGRISFAPSARQWVRDGLAVERVEPLALTAEIAADAAQLRFDGNPADRIIYATARAEGAPLVTRDERIRAFDPELVIW
jgi:PIN domain nuclease of toxin-antitoxin system